MNALATANAPIPADEPNAHITKVWNGYIVEIPNPWRADKFVYATFDDAVDALRKYFREG